MKSKQSKKLIVLSFVFSLFLAFSIPKVLAIDTKSISNINLYNITKEYDSEENSAKARHVSNNSSGKQDSQVTTWIGAALLMIIFLRHCCRYK